MQRSDAMRTVMRGIKVSGAVPCMLIGVSASEGQQTAIINGLYPMDPRKTQENETKHGFWAPTRSTTRGA